MGILLSCVPNYRNLAIWTQSRPMITHIIAMINQCRKHKVSLKGRINQIFIIMPKLVGKKNQNCWKETT